jgi:FAD/FMN-containing dehydrogenase
MYRAPISDYRIVIHFRQWAKRARLDLDKKQVTAQGGCLMGDIYVETAKRNLAVG